MDHGERRWHKAVRNTMRNTAHESITALLLVIPHLPLRVRKELLKIARTQSSTRHNSFLLKQTETLQKYSLARKLYFVDKDPYLPVFPLQTLIYKLSDACHHNPAFSAILSVLVRSAPIYLLNTVLIDQNRIESFEKELQAAIGPDRPQVLDYSLFFAASPDFDRSLSIYLPPAPLRNRNIWDRFQFWKQEWTRSPPTLYPQLTSFKNLSRITVARYHQFHRRPDGLSDGLYDVNPIDLEKTYRDFGVEIEGPCELRQAWKYNDLTPRTYFALGGTTFFASKYIREIANQLCNLFDPTGFKSRFSISRIPVTTKGIVYTYDYSSFTSNFTELKYFLRELMEYMGDIDVPVIDSRIGPTSISFSSLMDNYINCTTHRPEFTINRYLNECYDSMIHQKAGMLGVYGNIAFSTALHGLHACQLCGDLGECNCVGDDVLGEGPIDDEFYDAVSSIGSINPSKVKTWDYRPPEEEDGLDDRRWPYTKRPLERFGNRILLETAYFLPIFGAIIPLIDNARDITSEQITESHVRLLSVQACSLVRQLHATSLEDYDQYFLIVRYMRMLYLLTQVPSKGVYPWESYLLNGKETIRNLLLPALASFSPPYDLWNNAEAAFTSNTYRVPEIVYPDEEVLSRRRRLKDGPQVMFEGRLVSYGRKMGYLDVKPRYADRYFDSLEEYSRYYDEMFERVRLRTYDVVLLGGPDWFLELLSNEDTA